MELKMKSIYVSSLMLMLMLFSCNHTNLSLYRIQENGKFGFINNNGEVVIEPQYKYVGYFNKDGYATVITDFHYKVFFTSQQQVANKWTAFLVYQSVQK